MGVKKSLTTAPSLTLRSECARGHNSVLKLQCYDHWDAERLCALVKILMHKFTAIVFDLYSHSKSGKDYFPWL